MILKKAREDLVGTVSAILAQQSPGASVEWDNRKAFESQEVLRYVVEFVFADSSRLAMARTPCTRTLGSVVVTAKVREGAGTVIAYDTLDTLASSMRYKAFGVARVTSPTWTKPKTQGGWWSQGLVLPFYVDELT